MGTYSATASRKAISLLHIRVYRLSNLPAFLKTVAKHLQLWWFLLFLRSRRIFTIMCHATDSILGERGFSYVEVLAAIILIGTCLVPMLNGLYSMSTGPAILEERLVNRLALQAKMDEVLKDSFQTLNTTAITAGSILTPTTYSDIITSSDNRQIIRKVYMAFYDADNLDNDNDPTTGADPTLLYIKVAIDEEVDYLTSLVSQ